MLDLWVIAGRLGGNSQVRRDTQPTWSPLDEVYPPIDPVIETYPVATVVEETVLNPDGGNMPFATALVGAIAISAIVGLVGTVSPWMSTKGIIVERLDATQALGRLISLVLFGAALVFGLAGPLNKRARLAALSGVAGGPAILVGLFNMASVVDVSREIEHDLSFAHYYSASVGIGLYLIVIAGALLAVLSAFVLLLENPSE